MTLKQTKNQGFTIVELLIVIVVIAILAAITIVAYNGIQNRAKTSAGQSAANALMKKVEAFNTLNPSYPSFCSLVTNTTNSATVNPAARQTGPGSCVAGTTAIQSEPKLDDVSNISSVTAAAGTGYTATIADDNKVIGYWPCAAGANIFYWNYTAAGAGAIATVKAGAGC